MALASRACLHTNHAVIVLVSVLLSLTHSSMGARRLMELYKPPASDLFTYHNGSVLQGDVPISVIWYGHFTAAQKSIVFDFLLSLTTASKAPTPSVSQWWSSINRLYLSKAQCKNKIDNLKKRYKVECQRIAGGSIAASHWPWFKKMEVIVGNAASTVSPKPLAADDDKSRHQQQHSSKRCPTSGAGPLSVVIGSRIAPHSNPKWKRVLLKIGGTSLAEGPQNVDPKVIMLIAREVQVASSHGVEVAIVVGGRNMFCGDTWAAATGTDRAATYPIGMMASVMNAVLLQASLEKIGVETRVQTALMMQDIAELYIRRRAIRHLEKGRVVIFGGIGSAIGNPLFTTDTAAALRASEINADAVLKGTAGDDVYGCPRSNNNGPFEHISFRELVARGFSTMDMTAVTFCEENNIPVILFNMLEPGNISRALCGDQVGTLVDQSGRIS